MLHNNQMFFCLLMAEMAAATQAVAGKCDGGSNGSSSTMVRVQQRKRGGHRGVNSTIKYIGVRL
jgi:hypothetical protein